MMNRIFKVELNFLGFRFCLVGLCVAAMLSSASADWTLPFDRDLDLDILSPAPGHAWQFTGRKTLRFEPGEATPRGGFLNFPQALELRQLRLALLPVAGKLSQDAQRILVIGERNRTRHTLTFIRDGVIFNTSSPSVKGANRFTPVDGALAKGGTIKIVRSSGEAVVTNNDVEIGRFPAPQEPVDVSLRCVAMPMELSEVFVGGDMWPKPMPRSFTPVAQANYNDPDLAFYPPWPVNVPAAAAGIDLSPARSAPEVSEWAIGREDGLHSEFTNISRESVDFVVGHDGDKEFPHRLTSFKYRKSPESVRVFFNLKSGGRYTLRLSLASAKNLQNIVHVKVDGHLVQKDIYRGAVHAMFRDAIPLLLEKGAHVLEIQLELGQTSQPSWRHFVAFDSLALVPGDQPVIYERKAGEEVALNEQLAPTATKRTTGRDFRYRISELPARELDLVCSFYQPATSLKGTEVFDIAVNGKPWLKDFDIAAEGGSEDLIQRNVRVMPQDGEVHLHFKGTKGKALVNEILIKDGEKIITRINCGVAPKVFVGLEGAEQVILKLPDMPNLSTYKPERDLLLWQQKKGVIDFFDGHVNVVADPGFELSTPQTPAWKSIAEAPEILVVPQAGSDGEQGFDSAVQRSGKRSLRIAKTRGTFGVMANRFVPDWTRPYEFSGWVKGDGATGKTYLQIIWYGTGAKVVHHGNVDVAHSGGHGASRSGHLKSSESQSEAVAGTFDWKRITLRATPPRGAISAEFRLRSDDNSGAVWFDDLECDGYGALDVEAMVSNGGYATKSYKHAVVVSKSPLKQLGFVIRAKDGARQVFTGQLKDLGHKPMLNRQAYLAEFSSFENSGEYVLELEARRADGKAHRSLPFVISSGQYLDVAKVAAFYYFFARCGMEIPGYHEACHLDDGLMSSDYFDDGARLAGYRNMAGGWHDAGDWGKFHSRMIEPTYALATAALLHPPTWKYPGDKMPALVSEAAWGADYLVKISRGGGLFYANLFGGVWGIIPIAEPSVESDGDKNTLDGLGRPAAGYLAQYALTTPALALAQAAIAVRPYDGKRADDYLKIARENYENQTAFWRQQTKPDTEDWKRLVMEPKALWAAAALYRATGEAHFAKEADDWLLRVLPLLENGVQRSGEFFFAEPPKMNNFPYAYLQGVLDYIETFPSSPHAARARAVVAREIDQRILPDTSFANNPFGVHENLRSDTMWYYPEYNYTTEYFPKTASLLAWAADVLHRPDWRDAADRNFQWVIGNNHLQASYVAGIGQRQQPGWTGLFAVPGLRHGILPGAFTKGICWGNGRIAPWDQRSRVNWTYYGMPRGFGAFVIHDGVGFYSHGPALEIWEQFNGSLVLSAIRLQKARMPEVTAEASKISLPLGSPNLFADSGFEKSEALPEGWEAAGKVQRLANAAIAHGGSHCLKVVNPDDQSAAAVMTPRFKVKPGEIYWLRLWVKGRGKITTTASEQMLDQRWLSSQWQAVDMEYMAPAKPADSGEVRFSIHLSQGELFIDDVVLRRAPDIELPDAPRLGE